MKRKKRKKENRPGNGIDSVQVLRRTMRQREKEDDPAGSGAEQ